MQIEDLDKGIVLPVDKPYGWSSFQVVNKLKWQIKRQLGIKKFKIGHAGTLDPLATGMLLVCVGKATKRIDELQAGEKVYSGTIVLGATTPCFDLERSIDAYYPTRHLTLEKIDNARQGFLGEIEQVPPMYSAIKVAGQRAYEYARDGETAQIEPKKVVIHQFDIIAVRNIESPITELVGTPLPPQQEPSEKELYKHPQGIIPEGLPQIDFRIRCGKGTYIRSIARDLALALDTGGFLASLRREQVGDYHVDQSIKIESDIDADI